MVYVKAGKKVVELSDEALERLGDLSDKLDTWKDDQSDDYGEAVTKPVCVASTLTYNVQIDLNDTTDEEDPEPDAKDQDLLLKWSNLSTPLVVTKGNNRLKIFPANGRQCQAIVENCQDLQHC